jgi:hypothetical protein
MLEHKLKSDVFQEHIITARTTAIMRCLSLALSWVALIAERERRLKVVLKEEVCDVFFVSGQLRTRKIFERGHSRRVTAFVDRREGSDLAWQRLP